MVEGTKKIPTVLHAIETFLHKIYVTEEFASVSLDIDHVNDGILQPNTKCAGRKKMFSVRSYLQIFSDILIMIHDTLILLL